MARKVDRDGLQGIYVQLGQMDEAITMHIGDAEDRQDAEASHNLRHAGSALRSAQTSIRVILRREAAL